MDGPVEEPSVSKTFALQKASINTLHIRVKDIHLFQMCDYRQTQANIQRFENSVQIFLCKHSAQRKEHICYHSQ